VGFLTYQNCAVAKKKKKVGKQWIKATHCQIKMM